MPELRAETPIPETAFPKCVVFHPLSPATNIRKLWYVPLALRVRRLVHTIQPDILHAHQASPPGWLGAFSGYHPFMVTVWGSDLLIKPNRSRLYRILARWVMRSADYVTCVTQQLANIARYLGANPATIEVAPWGINTQIFHPNPTNPELRAQLGLKNGPIILNLRPIRPVYNPLDVARAIPPVLQEAPDAQFIVRTYAPDAELLNQFRAILYEAGVSEKVHYIGDLPNDEAIASLYRLVDVGISVPSSDGLPLSVLEALACGMPLVLSDLPSLREWIQEGQEGLFVPIGDAQAIADAIKRLCQDRYLHSQLRANGINLVRKRADREVLMGRMEEIYEQVVTFHKDIDSR